MNKFMHFEAKAMQEEQIKKITTTQIFDEKALNLSTALSFFTVGM